MRSGATAFAVLLLAAACGPLPGASPAPPTPAWSVASSEWTTYSHIDSNVFIAVPPGWQTLTPGPTTLQPALEDLKRRNPRSAFQSDPSVAAAGMKLLMTDGSPNASGYAHVLELDVAQSLTADDLVAAYRDRVSGRPNLTLVSLKKVRVSNVNAARADILDTVELPAGRTTLAVTQLLLWSAGVFYTVTLGCASEDAERYQPIFSRMVEGFRLIRGR